MHTRSLVRASAARVAVVAAAAIVTTVAIASPVGVEQWTALATGPALAGIDTVVLQVLENLTDLLDRVADFLTQLNRVLSEFAQLFGGGGGGGD